MWGVIVAIKFFLLTVAAEALVQLWFRAAPLQTIRNYLIRLTPFLYSREQESHLLDCKYCVSVWVGAVMAGVYFFMENGIVFFIIAALVIGRLSNFIHLGVSYLIDKQMDLRVARGRHGE